MLRGKGASLRGASGAGRGCAAMGAHPWVRSQGGECPGFCHQGHLGDSDADPLVWRHSGTSLVPEGREFENFRIPSDSLNIILGPWVGYFDPGFWQTPDPWYRGHIGEM